jgi:SAM-dependent methyltransferase
MTSPWRRAGRWLPRPLRRWLRVQAADARYRRRDILPDLRERLCGPPAGGVPLPPASLRRRVGLNSSREEFLTLGRGLSQSLLQAFEQASDPATTYPRWLDFGCGCGRVARCILAARVGEVSGVDVDRPSVAWARRHLGPRFQATSPRPPLPFPAASFDVVYAVSVFTHLDEPMQLAWLRELHRILRRGGLLLASTHHPDLQSTRPDLTAEQRQTLAAEGFLFASGGGSFNDDSSFHSPSYLARAWSPLFAPRRYAQHGLNGYQDLSVWEAR